MSQSGIIVSRRLHGEAVGAAAAKFSVAPADIQSRSNRRDVAHARQYAMWLLRQRRRPSAEPCHSYPTIGAAFGVDHATVIFACRQVEARLS